MLLLSPLSQPSVDCGIRLLLIISSPLHSRCRAAEVWMESASRTEKRNKGARPSDRKSEESCAFSDALSLLGRLGRLWGPSWRQPLGSSRGDEATRPERSRRRSETSNLQGRPRRHLQARRLSAAWFGSGPSSGSSGKDSAGSSRPNPTLGRDCLPGFGRSGAVPPSAGLFRCRAGSVTSSF